MSGRRFRDAGPGGAIVRALTAALAAFVLGAACVAAPAADVAGHDDLPWTAGEGRVTLVDQTIEEARDQARDLALKDAVAKATDSFLVRASDDYVQAEAGDSRFERFSRAIHREVSGKIVDTRNLNYDTEEPAPDVLQIVCRLEVRVVVENEEPNSDFVVRVDLRGNDSGIYRAGEELILEIRASLDCWITVFNVYADGTVSVLLPNAKIPDNRVTADTPFVLPDHEDPDQAFVHLRLGVPDGQRRTEEYIAVVATLKEYSFLSNTMTDFGAGYIPTYEAALDDLNRWILQIPASERAEADAYYTILE